MASAGLRIAEVLQGLARTGRTTNQLSREAQALRGLEFDEEARTAQALRNYRDQANNVNDNFLQSFQARLRSNQQFNPIKDFIQEQSESNEKKKKRLLQRSDDFNAHFNNKQMLQNPKYREVVNVENKNYMDDVEGLKTAYTNNTGLFRSGNTLYFSGTGGKSGLGAKVNDVFSDIFFIPTHNLQFSDKYRDVMNELEKNPDITRLVGHSLGSSVLQEINNRNNQKYITTTYNAPFVSMGNRDKDPHHLRFSNRGDVISALDRDAIKIDTDTINPVKAHKFHNMKTQGTFKVGEDNTMGINSHTDEGTIQQQTQQPSWNK